MKIAITAHGPTPQAVADSRLSQSEYFMLYDIETDVWECLRHTPNQNLAQDLSNSGTMIIITGYVGHKALKALHAEQIKIYSFGDTSAPVDAMLSDFLAGKLIALAAPNALDIVSEAFHKDSRRARFSPKHTSKLQ